MYLPRRKIKYDSFLLVYIRLDLAAVQDQKCFHGSMADSLVSIDKGMIHDD
jgi:hypothetical protein